MTPIKKYNIIDLFSGAGGLSLGFTQTGRVKIIAAAESNPSARKTYKRNFKVERVYPDVRTIDYDDLKTAVDSVDIVIGGPPCQGFSNANRQHTSIISMNNRLVKEYVRAIRELSPKAFVMENVAMLKSQVHRFMVDETDLNDDIIMGIPLRDEDVIILPESSCFEGALDFLRGLNGQDSTNYIWKEEFYKIINILYRFRINQPKFDASFEKYKAKLLTKLSVLSDRIKLIEKPSEIHEKDFQMAGAIQAYADGKADFTQVVSAVESAILVQRALLRIQELAENHIHIYEYESKPGGITAHVKSYAVRDYIQAMLSQEYTLHEATLNALHFGAPQRRERFIIIGLSQDIHTRYEFPAPNYSEENCRTVRDAISDLQEITPASSVDSKYLELEPHPNAEGLEKELRGKLLYNHVTTETRETAMNRFKALKEGQNFHDLSPELKATYSNAARTQNTIYMRLRYDEPCGTVVNVRKSMWIHPELDRAISIREAARLQTFPDSFIFEGTKDAQYQQVGNAVPPFLAKAIAKSVIASLDHKE